MIEEARLVSVSSKGAPDTDGVLAARSSRRSTSCSNDGDDRPATDSESEAELELERENLDGTISVWDVAEDRWVARESK